jgi:hypothetical protein
VMLGGAPWSPGLVGLGLPVVLATGTIAGVLGQGLAAACRWQDRGPVLSFQSARRSQTPT